jgi:hypothetical protein
MDDTTKKLIDNLQKIVDQTVLAIQNEAYALGYDKGQRDAMDDVNEIQEKARAENQEAEIPSPDDFAKQAERIWNTSPGITREAVIAVALFLRDEWRKDDEKILAECRRMIEEKGAGL